MRSYAFIYVAAVLIASVLVYWFLFGRNVVNRRAQLVLKNQVFDIEIAENATARAQGLSHRDSLPQNAGLLFLFKSPSKHGFWMKDMKFPIDILWFRGNELIGISKNAVPEPEKNVLQLKVYYPPAEADRVFEINAGLSDKYNFQPGDKFELRNYEIDPNDITKAGEGNQS
jgi:uncharacterized protein